MTDCFTKIREHVPRDISDSVLKEIIDQLERLKEDLNPGEFSKRAEAYFNKIREEFEIDKAYRLQNIQKINANQQYIKDLVAKGVDPMEALATIYRGSNALIPGEAKSVEGIAKYHMDRYQQMLVNSLEDKGVLKAVSKGELDKELYAYIMSKDALTTPHKVNISPEAKAVGDDIIKIFNGLFDDLKASGSHVKRLDGYIKQQHAGERIGDVPVKQWVDDIKGLLDLDRSFPDKTEIEINDVLEQAYSDIVTGQHSIGNDLSESLSLIKNGKNLDQVISRRRVFHFKNGEALFEYNQKYGRHTFVDGVLSYIRRASRNIALMEKLGPSPIAAHAKLKAIAIQTAENNPKLSESDKIRIKQGITPDAGLFWFLREKVDNLAGEARGITSIPGRSMAARFLAGVRSSVSMGMLGNTAIASMADFANAGIQLKSTFGENILQHTLKPISDFMSLVPSSQQKLWSRNLGIFANDMIHSVSASRFAGGEAKVGRMAKLQSLVLKAQLIPQQEQIAKIAVAKQFALELSDRLHLEFNQLSPRIQENLGRFEIGAHEWALLKHATEDFEGVKIITPEAVSNLPDSLIKKYKKDTGLKKPIARIKKDLDMAYGIYLRANADNAIPTPGFREKAILLQGTSPDDPMGMFLRMATQFKAFPLKMTSNLERAVLSKPGVAAKRLGEAFLGRADTQMLGYSLLSGTIFGYMALVATELTQGKTPRSPLEAKTLMEAMIKGGTAGLYGDMLLSEYNNLYHRFSSGLLGPSAPLLDSTATILSNSLKVMRGDPNVKPQAFSQALYTVGRMVPGQNLFWTKLGLDWLFLHQVKEYLNPGHARRMERRLKDTKGLFEEEQRYYLPPSAGL